MIRNTFIALIFGLALNSSAQTIAADDIVVQQNEKKNSNIPFFLNNTAGSLYYKSTVVPNGAGEKFKIPKCTSDEIKRKEVFGDSAGALIFDILYYNPEDSEQVNKKKSYPFVKAPYLETAENNPYFEMDLIQSMSRLIKIECLPMRFRIVEEGDKMISEKRLGDRAWDIVK